MKRIRITLIILVLIITAVGSAFPRDLETALSLNVQTAYTFGNEEGYGIDGGFAPVSYMIIDSSLLSHDSNDPGRSIGTTWGGAQAKVSISYIARMPFLKGEGPLFSGNNMEMVFKGELSPVSVNAITSLTITPLALLKLGFGAEVGTGWTLGFNGLGRNLAGVGYTAPKEEPFSGVVYGIWSSATFQFDFGAVIPGKWTHFVIAAVPRVQYRAFSGADNDTPWQYEADSGENFNGWKLYSTLFLGYQMPLFLDMVGFIADSEQYIDSNKDRSTMKNGGWGSDFVSIDFGPLLNFKLGERHDLTVILQFKNGRDYTDESIGNRYFEYRSYENTYYYLYRLALSYTMKIK